MLDHTQINLTDEQKQKVLKVEQLEKERKENQGVQMERESLVEYEKDATRARRTAFDGKYADIYKSSGDSSLVSLKKREDRIDKKDRDDFVEDQKFQEKWLKHDMKEAGENYNRLYNHQKDFLIEMRQLLRASRVFDNEVREAAAQVVKSHPEFMPTVADKNEKIENISRLLTAFLPQREFHFYPPSGNQKDLVSDFLSAFKKNPLAQTIKMQESLSGERLSKDFGDATAASQNFRMLYCDMKKREIMSKVLPLVKVGQMTRTDNEAVEDMKKQVPAYQELIDALSELNGISLKIPVDTEFNSKYVDPATIKKSGERKAQREINQRRGIHAVSGIKFEDLGVKEQSDPKFRERALDKFYSAYEKVRAVEKTRNDKYKETLNLKLVLLGERFVETRLTEKKYRNARQFLNNYGPSIYEGERVMTQEPLQGIQVETHTAHYHAERYMKKELEKAVKDANYTRFRRDNLSKVPAGASLPKAFLERNKEKEERRLRLLERRIDDLYGALDLMKRNRNFEDVLRNARSEKLLRIKSLYEHEVSRQASRAIDEEAMNRCVVKMNSDIASAEREFKLQRQADHKNYGQIEGLTDNDYKLTVSENLINQCNQMLADTKNKRIYLKVKEDYEAQLRDQKDAWKKDDKKQKAKERFLKHYGILGEYHADYQEKVELLRSSEEQREARRLKAVSSVEAENNASKQTLLFEDANAHWVVHMGGAIHQRNYVMRLMGNNRLDSFCNYKKEDIPKLTDQEKAIILLVKGGNKDLYKRLVALDPSKKIDEKNAEKEFDRIMEKYKAPLNLPETKGRYYPPAIKEEIQKIYEQHEGINGYNKLTGRMGYYVKVTLDEAEADIRYKETVIEKNKEYNSFLSSWKNKNLIEPGEGQEKKAFLSPREYQKYFKALEELKAYPADNSEYMTAQTRKSFDDVIAKYSKDLNDTVKPFNDFASKTFKQSKKEVDTNIPKLFTAGTLTKEQKEQPKLIHGIFLAQNALNKVRETSDNLNKILFYGTEEKYENKTGIGFIPDALITKDICEAHEWQEKTASRKLVDFQVKIKEEVDGRLSEVNAIHELKQSIENFKEEDSVPEKYKDILTPRQVKLRKISELILRCNKYLDKYDWNDKTMKSKDNIFGKKETAAEVKKMLEQMSKDYLPQLEEECNGRFAKSDDEEMWEFKKTRDKGYGTFQFASISTKHRLMLKYSRAWHVLSKYTKVDKKSQEEFKNKKNVILQRSLNYADYMNGYYTGDESEEQEEKFLDPELTYYTEHKEKIEKKKKALEEKIQKEMEEAMKKALKERNERLMEQFRDKLSKDTDLAYHYERFNNAVGTLEGAKALMAEDMHKELVPADKKLKADEYYDIKDLYRLRKDKLRNVVINLDDAYASKQYLEGKIRCGEIPDIFKLDNNHPTIDMIQKNVTIINDYEKEYQKIQNLNATSQLDLTTQFMTSCGNSDELKTLRDKYEKVDDFALPSLQKEMDLLDNALEVVIDGEIILKDSHTEINDPVVLLGREKGKKKEPLIKKKTKYRATLRDLSDETDDSDSIWNAFTEEEMTPQTKVVDGVQTYTRDRYYQVDEESRQKFEDTAAVTVYTATILKGKFFERLKFRVEGMATKLAEKMISGKDIDKKDLALMVRYGENTSKLLDMAEKQYEKINLGQRISDEKLEQIEKGGAEKYSHMIDVFTELTSGKNAPFIRRMEEAFTGAIEKKRSEFQMKKEALLSGYAQAPADQKEGLLDQIKALSTEIQEIVGYVSKWPARFSRFESVMIQDKYSAFSKEEATDETTVGEDKQSLASMLMECKLFSQDASGKLKYEREMYGKVQKAMKPYTDTFNALNDKVYYKKEDLETAKKLIDDYTNLLKGEDFVTYFKDGDKARAQHIKGNKGRIERLYTKVEESVEARDLMNRQLEILQNSLMLEGKEDFLESSEVKNLHTYRKQFIALQSDKVFGKLLAGNNECVAEMNEQINMQVSNIDQRLAVDKNNAGSVKKAAAIRKELDKILVDGQKIAARVAANKDKQVNKKDIEKILGFQGRLMEITNDQTVQALSKNGLPGLFNKAKAGLESLTKALSGKTQAKAVDLGWNNNDGNLFEGF